MPQLTMVGALCCRVPICIGTCCRLAWWLTSGLARPGRAAGSRPRADSAGCLDGAEVVNLWPRPGDRELPSARALAIRVLPVRACNTWAKLGGVTDASRHQNTSNRL
eukprot:1034389-Prorocentrum_minimum.AAC.4